MLINPKMKITIYTIAYNEEIMLPFFIEWYRKRFPDCKIVIYDNESTDKTVQIALNNNCEIITYQTNNQLSDRKYLEIKNNCWKNAETDWVIVCDVDEMLNIKEADLIKEDENGSTIIKSEGYDMVNLKNDLDANNMNCGCYSPGYSKIYCFKKSAIKEINYTPGAHTANPKGIIKYSDNVYNCFHKKYLNIDYLIERYKLFESRKSEENRKNGWGTQYSMNVEQIKREFLEKRQTCKEIK